MRTVIVSYENTESISGKFEFTNVDADDFKQILTMLRELHHAYIIGKEELTNGQSTSTN